MTLWTFLLQQRHDAAGSNLQLHHNELPVGNGANQNGRFQRVFFPFLST